jgi:hypothetical protein
LAIVRERLFLPLAIRGMRRFVTAGDGLATIIPRRGFSFRGLLTHVQISLEEPRNLAVSSPIRMQGRFARLCFFDQLADAFEGRFIEYPVGKPSEVLDPRVVFSTLVTTAISMLLQFPRQLRPCYRPVVVSNIDSQGMRGAR